jgi:hypothetical protein
MVVTLFQDLNSQYNNHNIQVHTWDINEIIKIETKII